MKPETPKEIAASRFLRLCFEPKMGIRIDDEEPFKHLAENYLSGFDVEYNGFISVASKDTESNNMEPLWQYIIWDATDACRDYLLEYLARVPMAGYTVHVFERVPGHNSVKVS